MPKITIAIDCQSLLGDIQTGLGVYTRNLIDALEKFRGDVNIVKIMPLGKKPFRTTPQRIIWEQVWLPWYIARSDCDIFHSPALGLPLFGSRKKVATAHDVIIMKHPELMKGLAKRYFGDFIPRGLQKADHVIANSKATKKDLMKYLRIPDGNITVIHLGVGKEFLKPSDQDITNNLRRKNHLSAEYLLSVASFEPRKNHAGMLKGFAKAAPKLPKDLKLALVGRENKYQYQMRALAEELGISDRIAFCGYLGAKELPAFYQGAAMLVFPSLDEGFGIPVLEAFAKGIPVIASSIEAIQEVADDAVMYINPNRDEEIADAITALYGDLALREALVEKGKLRVRQFSWEENARETVRVYNRVLGRTKGLS